MESYYNRKSNQNEDGTTSFANDRDSRNEFEVCKAIEFNWNCQVKKFDARFYPIDFYIIKDGDIVAFAELKTRSHTSTTYPTVFLNLRKWYKLIETEIGLRLPAYFFVKFTDGIRYQRISSIDTRKIRMGGTAYIVKAETDIEPMIEVPIDNMKLLNNKEV